MTFYFAASEIESVTTVGGNIFSDALDIDSDFQRAGMVVASGTGSDGTTNPRNGIIAEMSSNVTEAWLHFIVIFPPLGSATDRQFFELRDDVGGVGVFRFDQENGSLEFEVNESGSYVNQGASYPLPSDSELQVDVHVVLDTGANTGTIDVFFDKVAVASYSGSIDASLTGMDTMLFTSVRPGAAGNSTNTRFREIIVSSDQTTEMRLATLNVDGAGTENTFATGTFTDVDDIALDDGTVVSSDTVAQRIAMSLSDLTANAQLLNPLAVVVGARMRNSGGGPTNMKIGLKTSSGDVLSANKALSAGYDAYFEVFETNTATVADWTIADINAMELLLESG